MSEPTGIRILEHFMRWASRALNARKTHWLMDLVTIAPYAVICGANEGVEAATVGRGKPEWFQHFWEIQGCIVRGDARNSQSEEAEAMRPGRSLCPRRETESRARVSTCQDLCAGAVEDQWRDVHHSYIRDGYRDP